MDELKQLGQIDWWYVFIAVVIAFICIKYLWSLAEWFIGKIGLETKRMRQRRQEREQLKATTELAEATAKSLKSLQDRCTKDEDEFRNNLHDYMEESRLDRQAIHSEMTLYATNRINDRQQSLAIQKELQGSQDKIANRFDDICKKLDDMVEKENN